MQKKNNAWPFKMMVILLLQQFNILKSMNKIVLYEWTSQRAGGAGKPVWES